MTKRDGPLFEMYCACPGQHHLGYNRRANVLNISLKRSSMHHLPTGTVTLLFTEIEGSTRLLQQLGERYVSVLTAYRQLLPAVFQQWNGHEADTPGCSCLVAFAR